MSCRENATATVCMVAADGTRTSAVAHYTYGDDVAGGRILASTRYTDASGAVLYDPAAYASITVGACSVRTTSLIEGCVLSDPADPGSEKLSAFTLVDETGAALFAPKLLTDLGFVECC